VASAQDAAKYNVEVAGLSICRKDAASEFGQGMVPGLQVGTQVYVHIANKDAFILKVAGDGKTSVTMKDSTGKTLAADENYDFAFFANVAEDNRSVTIPLVASDLPGADATHIDLKGTVALSCGVDATTETSDVSLAVDTQINLGPVTAKVTRVEEGFDADSYNFGLESDQPFDAIQSIALVDASGKEIPCESAGSSSFGFGDSMTYSRDYRFTGQPSAVTKLKVTYFQRVVTEAVPIEFQVGLGLKK